MNIRPMIPAMGRWCSNVSILGALFVLPEPVSPAATAISVMCIIIEESCLHAVQLQMPAFFVALVTK